jgi:N-acyl-D-amino-acid deacylase
VTSSDGSDGHPRQYATFPRKYVKYVVEDKVISLAEFVRSSTGRAADMYMLDHRGYLKDGYFADVTVIDLKNYKPVADYKRPRELASGVDAIFVNGKAAILDGKTTGELAGAVLKHPPTAGTCK